MANLLKGSLQKELNTFFKTLNKSWFPVSFITKGAFTKARKKISHKAFIELKDELLVSYKSIFPIKTWKEFRLVAIDGSTIKLPKAHEIMDHFGTQNHENDEACPMARVSQSFDVLNDLTLDALIAPIKTGELSLSVQHISKAPDNTLFLLDRGYPALWLFSWIRKGNHHFCARAKNSWSGEVVDFLNSGDKERIVSIKPHHSSYAQFRKMELLRTSLKVRLIRIELNSSETEVLITSLLDCKKFPHSVFKELYFKRWGIEEDYKCLKHRIELGNFSGKTLESIYQDFHAKIFSKNLTSIIVNPVEKSISEKTSSRKYRYKVNFTYALAEMKHFLISIFSEGNPEVLLTEFLKLVSCNIEPERKNRKFPRRKEKSRRKYSFGCKSTG